MLQDLIHQQLLQNPLCFAFAVQGPKFELLKNIKIYKNTDNIERKYCLEASFNFSYGRIFNKLMSVLVVLSFANTLKIIQ